MISRTCQVFHSALLSSLVFCQAETTRLFSDIPSQADRARFDSFPLVSRTVREASWCEGVQEVAEVRQVGGQTFTKEFLLDNTHTRQIKGPDGADRA